MNTLASKLVSGITRLTPFGKPNDDPLTNLKSASHWLGSLPIGDAFKCQEAILHELKRFNENSSQFTKARLAVLMLLDEKSRDLQDTLVRQYLRNPRMSRSVESQLWHAVYGLYWEVARGYHAFVLHFMRESGKSPHDDLIPLITLRAIQTLGQLLRWRATRYLPAGEKVWLRLHNLYRIAETENFQRRSMRAYAEDGIESSCENAYLHIMMLNLANSGTLYPKQLDLLDHWLDGWNGLLQLDTHLDPEAHHFAIDLSADHGPRRVRKPDPDKPMRCWGVTPLLDTLSELQAALQAGRSPAELGLTESARTAESLELLAHLQHHWSSLSTREQRRAPREPVKRLVDVAHGLGTVIAQIKLTDTHASVSPYGVGLNYSETDDVQLFGFITDSTREKVSQIQMPPSLVSPDVERWIMHDESECGYGATVESHDKDWLRVGALISVKSHDSATWKLGVVRRLSRLDNDTSSVGIETLASAPALAMLYDTTTSGYTVNGAGHSSANLPQASLWMANGDGTDSVVIDPVHYMPGKIFQVHGIADHAFIALGKPMDRSEGWIRVMADPVVN